MHDERRRGAVGEHAAARVEPRRGIEHDADGIRARDVPDRELRIVARDGARADDDGGRQRAQPVQMPDVVRARHVIGIAGRRRDVAVEALAQVRERERPRRLRGHSGA